MTTGVYVQGALEPIILDGDFVSLVNSINLAKASGRSFMVADRTDGSHVAIMMDNILWMDELEEDDSYVGDME